MNTTITEILIHPLKGRGGLVAIASFVMDEKVYLGGIGVYTKLSGGYRLTFPTRSLNTNPKRFGDEREVNIYYPINREFGLMVEASIIKEYERLMESSIVKESINKDNSDEDLHTEQQ